MGGFESRSPGCLALHPHERSVQRNRPHWAWDMPTAGVGAALLTLLLVACTPTAAPTDIPTATPPGPEYIGSVLPPTPTPIGPPTAEVVTPVATSAISVTLQSVSFDPSLDVRPGPWAPDGKALVANVIVDEGGRDGPTGHLWTVDAEHAQALWDSGDIEGALGQSLAAWLPDGTLVLARADGMWVNADGSPAGDIAGIDDQVREVVASPDGQTIVAVGPNHAWLIGADGTARAVRNDVGARLFDTWAWRPDSRTLAIYERGGNYYALDTATAALRALAELPGPGHDGPAPVPSWLADGWIVPGEADEMVAVHADSGEVKRLEELLGIATIPGESLYGLPNVSPDGRFALYRTAGPATLPSTPDSAYPEPRPITPITERVRDSFAETTRDIEPYGPGYPEWAPTGDRYAVLNERGLEVYAAADGRKWSVLGPERHAQHFEWSPDGLWLAYYTIEGGPWLVASDGSAGPVRVAQGRPSFWGSITWSPTGDRFAVAVPNTEAAVAEADATDAAAPPNSTAVPVGFASVPSGLVLVTIRTQEADPTAPR